MATQKQPRKGQSPKAANLAKEAGHAFDQGKRLFRRIKDRKETVEAEKKGRMNGIIIVASATILALFGLAVAGASDRSRNSKF